MLKVSNQRNGLVIAETVKEALSFKDRLFGLLGTKDLAESHGLLLSDCKCVHMFFMKYAIDAIFINEKNVVCGLEKNLNPWRISRYYFKASKVLEVSSGVISANSTEIGDLLIFTTS